MGNEHADNIDKDIQKDRDELKKYNKKYTARFKNDKTLYKKWLKHYGEVAELIDNLEELNSSDMNPTTLSKIQVDHKIFFDKWEKTKFIYDNMPNTMNTNKDDDGKDDPIPIESVVLKINESKKVNKSKTDDDYKDDSTTKPQIIADINSNDELHCDWCDQIMMLVTVEDVYSDGICICDG
eukprot:94271_1